MCIWKYNSQTKLLRNLVACTKRICQSLGHFWLCFGAHTAIKLLHQVKILAVKVKNWNMPCQGRSRKQLPWGVHTYQSLKSKEVQQLPVLAGLWGRSLVLWWHQEQSHEVPPAVSPGRSRPAASAAGKPPGFDSERRCGSSSCPPPPAGPAAPHQNQLLWEPLWPGAPHLKECNHQGDSWILG